MLGVFRRTAQMEEHRWIPQSGSWHRTMSRSRPSCCGACSTGEVCEQILGVRSTVLGHWPKGAMVFKAQGEEVVLGGAGQPPSSGSRALVPCGWPVCRKHGVRSSARSTWKERAYRALGSETVGRSKPPVHLSSISGESLVGQPVRKMVVLPHWGHLKNKNVIFILLKKEKKGIIFAPAWTPKALISFITKRFSWVSSGISFGPFTLLKGTRG